MHEGIHFFQNGNIIGGDQLPFDRPADLVPRHVLITGLGRSGTTACASIAAALGLHTESPTPYLENWSLRQHIINRDAEGALARMASWQHAGERRFWKDPKIWVPQFDPFLDKIPASIGLLFVFRDPLNIAARDVLLSQCDLLERMTEVSHAAHQLVSRLQSLRHRNVALISYEKLLMKPEIVVKSLARFLQISDPDAIRSAVDLIEPTPIAYEAHFKPRGPIIIEERR